MATPKVDRSSISRVATENAPAAIGPYVQAVVHAGLVFCSGQIGLDPRTTELVEGGIEEQTDQVMRNLQAVLEEAGTSLARALRCTIYLVEMAEFAAVNKIYGSFFEGQDPPARATVEVSKLPKGALVEIDCIAAL